MKESPHQNKKDTITIKHKGWSMAEDLTPLDFAMQETVTPDTTGSGWNDSVFTDFDSQPNPFDNIGGEFDAGRAAELKKKELYRKGKLQYEDDGTLINDSNAMIRAKEVANAGIRGTDWLLEASENIADF